MRAVAQELAYVDSATNTWHKAVLARRNFLAQTQDKIMEHRETVEMIARNKTIQVNVIVTEMYPI